MANILNQEIRVKLQQKNLVSKLLSTTRACALITCATALATSPLVAQEYGAAYPGGAAAFELSGGTLTYQIVTDGSANGVTVGGTNIGANFSGNSYAAGSVAFAGDLDGANLQILGGPSATIVLTGEGGGGDDPPDTSPCAEDAGCVNDDRFEVIVTAVTAQGANLETLAFDLTNDTDYFTFPDDPNNVEVFVKVPAGTCFLNNFWWVFAGGATDTAVTIRVRDTATGEVKTYSDPPGPFEAVNDTSAFATCPD